MINIPVIRGTVTYTSVIWATRWSDNVAAFSEIRRPWSGWVIGCTYNWFGCPQGHLEGVAVAVVDRQISMVTEVTPVKKCIIRLRIIHTLGVISLVSVYAPTGISAFYVKETFYAQL